MSVHKSNVEIETDENEKLANFLRSLKKAQVFDGDDLVSYEKKVLAKVSSKNPTNDLNEVKKTPTELTKQEENVKLPEDDMETKPIEIKKDKKHKEKTATQIIEKERMIDRSIDRKVLQSKPSKENRIDESFSMIPGLLKSWSESTQSKLGDLDRLSQDILDLKNDMLTIKSILTSLSKILTS